MAMDDLSKGAYSGQFGLVYIEDGNDRGAYDQEPFLVLRDWAPFYSTGMDDDDDDTHDGPLLEKPPEMSTDPDGLEVASMTYSINDKALGAGEPIRVKEGQRVLVHFCNASAIENRRVALAGHSMRVISMDGNPVPKPQPVDPTTSDASAMAVFFRVGVELVSALLVGLAVGWGLDRLLGTRPLLLLLFVFLGGIAGIVNVWRVVAPAPVVGRKSRDRG